MRKPKSKAKPGPKMVWRIGLQVHHTKHGVGEVVEEFKGVTGYANISQGVYIRWTIKTRAGRIFRVSTNDRAGWHQLDSKLTRCPQCNPNAL